MKKLLYFLILVSSFSFLVSPVFASSKNIFGLHLTQTQDIDSAAKIINSSGGDWGYATIVIRLDQLDKNTWQDFFDKCRKYHIVPLVRLATIMENGHWKRPANSDIDNLANFLHSLNWPTTPQHIILFNEINHASEWGGAVDIKNFTDTAIYTAQKFKSLSPHFYILSSPLDLAAPEKPDQFKSAANVYQEIFLYRPEYFHSFDALASHSYPNHGYIGTPYQSGRHSIRGYQWELGYLRSLGVNATYPVFITETGWPHREGVTRANQYYTTDTASKFLLEAINIWSADSRVVAITPFIYNYPHPPFDHFSWLDSSEQLYPNYQRIVDSPKSRNSPSQITAYELSRNRLPLLLLTDADYSGQLILKNTGQSIWGETKFCLNPQSSPNVTLDAVCTGSDLIYPGQQFTFNYKVRISSKSDYKDKTFISWQGLPILEIAPVNSSGTIYAPSPNPLHRLLRFFQGMFI